MAVSPAEDLVRFGLFELDLKGGQLSRNGSPLRLPQQPLQLLAVLLERAGEIVTRDELRQRLWPSDVFVDFDHGLNKSVQKLRDALGDSASSPRFIETIPRVGYRFIAPVRNGALPPAAESKIPARFPNTQHDTAPDTQHDPAPVVAAAAVHRQARWWFLSATALGLAVILGITLQACPLACIRWSLTIHAAHRSHRRRLHPSLISGWTYARVHPRRQPFYVGRSGLCQGAPGRRSPAYH